MDNSSQLCRNAFRCFEMAGNEDTHIIPCCYARDMMKHVANLKACIFYISISYPAILPYLWAWLHSWLLSSDAYGIFHANFDYLTKFYPSWKFDWTILSFVIVKLLKWITTSNLKTEIKSPQWDSAFTGNDRKWIDQVLRFCSTLARVSLALLNEVVKDVKDRIVTFA